MIINVTGRGTTVQDTFRDMMEKKLSRFDRFFHEDTRADVTVIQEGGRETVEISIHSDGMTYRSESTTYDRFESLDLVVQSLSRQIVKNRSKLQDRFRQQAVPRTTEFDPEQLMKELGGEKIEDEGDYHIARTKSFELKPMLPDEAVLQMNMVGHSFFMFLNGDTDLVSVVYKRDGGDYGLIEPV